MGQEGRKDLRGIGGETVIRIYHMNFQQQNNNNKAIPRTESGVRPSHCIETGVPGPAVSRGLLPGHRILLLVLLSGCIFRSISYPFQCQPDTERHGQSADGYLELQVDSRDYQSWLLTVGRPSAGSECDINCSCFGDVCSGQKPKLFLGLLTLQPKKGTHRIGRGPPAGGG